MIPIVSTIYTAIFYLQAMPQKIPLGGGPDAPSVNIGFINSIGKLFGGIPRTFWVIFGIVFVLGMLIYGVYKYKQKQKLEAAAAAEEAGEEVKPDEKEIARRKKAEEKAIARKVKESFDNATKYLKRYVGTSDYRYKLPWYLVVGDSGVGKTNLLQKLNLPYSKDFYGQEQTFNEDLNWFIYENSVVLDLKGSFAFANDDNGKPSNSNWLKVLKNLQRFRPQRPIDGIIYTISATELLNYDEYNAEEFDKRSAIIQNYLVGLHEKLGMKVPVYVVVSQCDLMPEFKSFCSNVPSRLSDDGLGWSNPYSFERAYSTQWLNDAFSEIKRQLYSAQIEILSQAKNPGDYDGLFMLPKTVSSLLPVLRNRIDAIFKPSAFSNVLLFRGVYLSGQGMHFPAGVINPADEADDEDVRSLVTKEYQAYASVSSPTLVIPDEEAPTENESEIVENSTPTPNLDPRFIGKEKLFFARNLFATKIFQEYTLATPDTGSFFSRNRTVLITQIATFLIPLIFGVGILFAYSGLDTSQKSMTSLLKDMYDYLGNIYKLERLNQEVPDEDYLKSGTRVLKGISEISGDNLRSVFVPSSYITGLHGDVKSIISVTYHKVIFKAMLIKLESKASSIVTIEANESSNEDLDFLKEAVGVQTKSADLITVSNNTEFIKLKEYIEQLTKLEYNILLYNDLDKSGTLRKIRALSSYLFEIELPVQFEQEGTYYERSVEERALEKFRYDKYAEPAHIKASLLIGKFAESFFDNNIVKNQVMALVTGVKDLDQAIGEFKDVENARNLVSTIESTELLLSNPMIAWITKQFFEGGPDYNKVVADLQNSMLLKAKGEDPKAIIDFQVETRLDQLQENLLEQQTPMTGLVLNRENKGGDLLLKTEFTPKVTELKLALSNLLNQKFMSAKYQESIPNSVDENSLLQWNTAILTQANSLYDPFTKYSTEEVGKLPIEFAPLKMVALGGFKTTYVGYIAQAANTEPISKDFAEIRSEDDIRAEVQSFQVATETLNQIFRTLRQERIYVGGEQDLRDLIRSQSSNIFKSLRQRLDKDNVYLFNDRLLENWNGDRRVSVLFNNAQDSVQLADYLDKQLATVTRLSNDYAKILTDFLATQGGDMARSPGYIEWQNILRELQKNKDEVPGNHVVLLENLIYSTLSVELVNCSDVLSSREAKLRIGESFFLDRRDKIRKAMKDRCDFLTAYEIRNGYNQLRLYFSKRLQGRFPFVATTEINEASDAEPKDIFEFLMMYDRYMKIGGARLSEMRNNYPQMFQAAIFLDNMRSIRDFLHPIVGGVSEDNTPTFEGNIYFRTNPKKEVNGNQLIDWYITIGGKTIRSFSPDKRWTWRYGDSIYVVFKWAKDAPKMPEYNPNRPDFPVIDVKNRTVTYAFTKKWSLIEFLQKCAMTENDWDKSLPLKDLYYMLGFNFNVKPNLDKQSMTPSNSPNYARLFMRMGVFGADKKTELRVNTIYPTIAPQFGLSK